MAGGDEGVGIDESSPFGVIISALQVIDTGILGRLVAIALSFCYYLLPGGGTPPPRGERVEKTVPSRQSFRTHTCVFCQFL